MRLLKIAAGLLLASILAACGGGSPSSTAPSGDLGAPLADAKPLVVDASKCTAGNPEFMTIKGQCVRAFLGLTPQPKSAKGPAAAGKGPLATPGYLDAVSFFDWLGPALPQYFGYTYADGYYGNYFYRYYYATGNYLIVADGYVYVYGEITYYSLYPIGALNDFYCNVYNCYARTFTSWNGSDNGVVVKDANNESFAFYSDTGCLYSYARDEETTNFCLTYGYHGNFAGQSVEVWLVPAVSGGGCVAVLADPYGYQVDIYTDIYGIQNVTVQNSWWVTGGGC